LQLTVREGNAAQILLEISKGATMLVVGVFGTGALPGWVLALLIPMPLLVWGIDETYRALRRKHAADVAETR
jgi:hypothetical protein